MYIYHIYFNVFHDPEALLVQDFVHLIRMETLQARESMKQHMWLSKFHPDRLSFANRFSVQWLFYLFRSSPVLSRFHYCSVKFLLGKMILMRKSNVESLFSDKLQSHHIPPTGWKTTFRNWEIGQHFQGRFVE